MSFDVVVSFDVGALNVIELNSFNPFFDFCLLFCMYVLCSSLYFACLFRSSSVCLHSMYCISDSKHPINRQDE